MKHRVRFFSCDISLNEMSQYDPLEIDSLVYIPNNRYFYFDRKCIILVSNIFQNESFDLSVISECKNLIVEYSKFPQIEFVPYLDYGFNGFIVMKKKDFIKWKLKNV